MEPTLDRIWVSYKAYLKRPKNRRQISRWWHSLEIPFVTVQHHYLDFSLLIPSSKSPQREWQNSAIFPDASLHTSLHPSDLGTQMSLCVVHTLPRTSFVLSVIVHHTWSQQTALQTNLQWPLKKGLMLFQNPLFSCFPSFMCSSNINWTWWFI
jgi:hypothetical protein